MDQPNHLEHQLTELLAARSVDVRYDPTRKVLEEVTLQLLPGKLTAVIGTNGSGKSTLIRTLSRTLVPSAGAVLLGERDLYTGVSARDSARAIAVVPQGSDVFLDFTVGDIVAMGRAPHRTGRSPLAPDTASDTAAIEQALTRMRIGPALAAKPIGQVSGGERQRALIARALAQGAGILLLDEPTASLDLHNQTMLLGWLRSLANADRRSVLVALHDLNLAAEFADRIIVLHGGRIFADGTPERVVTPEIVAAVYGMRVSVHPSAVSGRPVITTLGPVDEHDTPDCHTQFGSSHSPRSPLRVHLFCGAGTGARIMFNIVRAGMELSASILHDGDSDSQAAISLNIPFICAPAFSQADEHAITKASRLAADAEVAVLTALPKGEINGALFDLAASFAESKRPLLVMRGGTSDRTALEASLGAASNIVFVNDYSEIMQKLHQLAESIREC